jgi:thiol-disulfide isomerase/thioredoxin
MVTEITMAEMIEPLPYQDSIIRVVMFYGPTCGPCKATMPHYEAVSTLFEGMPVDIQFFKINAWEPVEQKEFVSTTYGINGVPHFKSFFRGQNATEKIGGGDEATMKKFIYEVIDEVFKQHGGKINEG